MGYTASEFKQFLLVQVYNEMPFQREKKNVGQDFIPLGMDSLDCEKWAFPVHNWAFVLFFLYNIWIYIAYISLQVCFQLCQPFCFSAWGRIWIMHSPLPPLSKAGVGGRINEWLIDVMAADRQ